VLLLPSFPLFLSFTTGSSATAATLACLELTALRGESIGGIESTLACPGTQFEHTAFFSRSERKNFCFSGNFIPPRCYCYCLLAAAVLSFSLVFSRNGSLSLSLLRVVSGRHGCTLKIRASFSLSLFLSPEPLSLSLSLSFSRTKCGLGEERPLAASISQHFHQISTFCKVVKVAGLL
jgi:hypothetical protein